MRRALVAVVPALLAQLVASSPLVGLANNASAATLITIDNNTPNASPGWDTFYDPSALGGSYRASSGVTDKAFVHFVGTSITWFTHAGPDQGIATVTIDGVSVGTFNEYSPTPGLDQHAFRGLTSAAHTLIVHGASTADPSSAWAYVSVDGFAVGAHFFSQDSPRVKYDSWKTVKDPNAIGGSYVTCTRSSNIGPSFYSAWFTGPSVTLLAETGPAEGKADVIVDGSSYLRNLYSPTQQSQVPFSFTTGTSPFGGDVHNISVGVPGQKDPSSTGIAVAVDAFEVPGLPPALARVKVTHALDGSVTFPLATTAPSGSSSSGGPVPAGDAVRLGIVTKPEVAGLVGSPFPYVSWSLDPTFATGVTRVQPRFVSTTNTGDRWTVIIPGQSSGAEVYLYVTASDRLGNVLYDPGTFGVHYAYAVS